MGSACAVFLNTFILSAESGAGLISLNNLQPCKLLAVLFFQRVCNVSGERLVAWDRDVLKRVGALLCPLDAVCQAVCGVFHHGQLYRKLLHLFKVVSGLI